MYTCVFVCVCVYPLGAKQNYSRRHCLFFKENKAWHFMLNRLPSRRITWNFKRYFLLKIPECRLLLFRLAPRIFKSAQFRIADHQWRRRVHLRVRIHSCSVRLNHTRTETFTRQKVDVCGQGKQGIFVHKNIHNPISYGTLYYKYILFYIVFTQRSLTDSIISRFKIAYKLDGE